MLNLTLIHSETEEVRSLEEHIGSGFELEVNTFFGVTLIDGKELLVGTRDGRLIKFRSSTDIDIKKISGISNLNPVLYLNNGNLLASDWSEFKSGHQYEIDPNGRVMDSTQVGDRVFVPMANQGLLTFEHDQFNTSPSPINLYWSAPQSPVSAIDLDSLPIPGGWYSDG